MKSLPTWGMLWINYMEITSWTADFAHKAMLCGKCHAINYNGEL